jgi:membrane-bound lytic murein transglycosylase D
MNQIRINLLAALLFIISIPLTISAVNDTIPSGNLSNSYPEVFQFENSLDSLVNVWYVKKSLANLQVQPWFAKNDSLNIPEFADEVYIQRLDKLASAIDLPYNDIVKAFINVYTKQKRDKAEIMLGLSDYYFPMFEEVFDAYGLPIELKYLALVESALNPKAVSKAGATGLWQFMFSTGKQYHLEITSFVDDRNDPIKATHAAARFLKDLYGMFNDWTLAIAAYNCGPGNVMKAIRRSGGKTNYWDIYYNLPLETRGYVPAFIAATYTANYFKEHNMVPDKIDIPLATDTIIISDDLHLEQVSNVLNIPLPLLREMNPQYKRDVILPKQKEYALTLPQKYSHKFILLQDSIFAFNDSIYFNPENKFKSPSNRLASSNGKARNPENRTKIYYKVKSGDNLGLISSWYDVSISDIKQWNNLRGNKLIEGQKLSVFVPKSKKGRFELVNSMSFDEKQNSINSTATAQNKVTTEGKGFVNYTVRKGDTLFKISKKYPGVSNEEIMSANNITNARTLSVGQKLKIPKN